MNDLPAIRSLRGKTCLVVIDEAHQAVAPTYKHVLEMLVVPNDKIFLLGLSATPGRTWNEISEDRKLADFFNKRKITLKIEGYNNPIDYLVDNGYLAKTNFESLSYDGEIGLTEDDLNKINAQLDIPKNILRRLEKHQNRNLSIILRVKQLSQRHKRILVFAASVEHSNLLATVIKAYGLNAHSITSKTLPHIRKRRIIEYKEDTSDVRILCNYGVLTTGFDAPKTSAAVIARPTKSLVLYSQMIGRAMRGKKANGNDEAEIVTVIDRNLPGFRSVSEAFLNWEDVYD